MPPKKSGRRKRGKDLLDALRESEPSSSEADISPEYLETVISELENENDRRIKKLKRSMGDMRQELLNHFQVELLKIPRKVREMKVEHFSSEFGGSIEIALKKAASYELAKTQLGGALSVKTPSGNRLKAAATPSATYSRAPRPGERIMSANGSPLAAVPLSTTKSRRQQRQRHIEGFG